MASHETSPVSPSSADSQESLSGGAEWAAVMDAVEEWPSENSSDGNGLPEPEVVWSDSEQQKAVDDANAAVSAAITGTEAAAIEPGEGLLPAHPLAARPASRVVPPAAANSVDNQRQQVSSPATSASSAPTGSPNPSVLIEPPQDVAKASSGVGEKFRDTAHRIAVWLGIARNTATSNGDESSLPEAEITGAEVPPVSGEPQPPAWPVQPEAQGPDLESTEEPTNKQLDGFLDGALNNGSAGSEVYAGAIPLAERAAAQAAEEAAARAAEEATRQQQSEEPIVAIQGVATPLGTAAKTTQLSTPLILTEQPYDGVVYANRSLTDEERRSIDSYQEDLRDYYDQMMSDYSELLSPWGLVDEGTDPYDQQANETIRKQVRHYISLADLSTLTVLRGSHTVDKSRVRFIEDVPEISIASVSGVSVQYASKPQCAWTEEGPDGAIRTVVAVGTKIVHMPGEASLIRERPLLVDPAPKKANEEYAVEYYIIPGEYDSSTLGSARLEDMRPRPRDDDISKWDRTTWNRAQIRQLDGIDPNRLQMLAGAVGNVFGMDSVPLVPAQQFGLPPSMVYPEHAHPVSVRRAVAYAKAVEAAQQAAAAAQRAAELRDETRHQELLDALRSKGA